MSQSLNKRFFVSGSAVAAALFIIAGAALIAPASAAPVEEPRQVVVNYSDLNISDPRGAKKLYTRILQAAETVCGTPDSIYLRLRQLRKDCIDSAVEAAVRDVDHPGLRAHHVSKGRPARVALHRAP